MSKVTFIITIATPFHQSSIDKMSLISQNYIVLFSHNPIPTEILGFHRTWRPTSRAPASSSPTSGLARSAQPSQEVDKRTIIMIHQTDDQPGDTTPPTPRPTSGPTKPTNQPTTSHGPGPTDPTQVIFYFFVLISSPTPFVKRSL